MNIYAKNFSSGSFRKEYMSLNFTEIHPKIDLRFTFYYLIDFKG